VVVLQRNLSPRVNSFSASVNTLQDLLG